jgi:cytochrome bd-type quinol oxidase subunit 2
MPLSSNLPGYRRLQFLRNSAVRTGIYTGVCLALVFSVWLVIANQVPFLERFYWERDIAAAAVLCFLATVPVVRFFRMPGNLVASSMTALMIFSLCYSVLCMIYHRLSDRLSPLQVLVTGTVVYMIFTTLSWIGTIIRKVRAAHLSHPQQSKS